MIHWFKHRLVPHEGNDYRPRLLHGEGARMTVIMVLVFEIFVFLLPTVSFYEHAKTNMAAVLPAVLGTLTNKERQQQSLPALTVSPALTHAAELKAQDMADKGYFAHTSPEGRTPWYWLKAAGYDYQYAGENLAINFSDSKDVTNAWMNSAGHRANIVKGMYTEVGTGVATGMYQGRETIFVAQVYASPLPKTTPVPVAVTEIPKESVAAVTPALTEQGLSQNVLGAETPVVPEVVETTSVDAPTFTERASASPTHTTNTVLMIVAGVIALVVILTVVIKINTQHPDLITNGLAVVAVIGGIMIGNTFLSSKGIITSQTEYSYIPDTLKNEW